MRKLSGEKLEKERERLRAMLEFEEKAALEGYRLVFGIDEDAGEVVSPNARQLYAAARYFENASGTIKTREGGETAVFCFD